MADTYLQINFDEENGDIITNGFSINAEQIAQVSDVSVLPNVIRNDRSVDASKDLIGALQLQRFGASGDSYCGRYNNAISNDEHQPASATSISQGDGCHQIIVDDRERETECLEGELPQENFVYMPTDHSYASGGTDESPNDCYMANDQDDQNQVLEALEMIQGREIMETINGIEMEKEVEFIAVESDKKRNPPYLIKDKLKITTKNNEPIKICLTGAKVNQVVIASLRYTEEKYKNNAVTSCKLHCKEGSDFNFELSHTGDRSEGLAYDKINEHPTVHLTLMADMFTASEMFVFYITIRCLNSCASHKENGKKMEIIFKLVDQITSSLLKETHFDLRACKNVKRDYREAFIESTSVNSLQPESFLLNSQEEAQVDPCVNKEAKRQKKKNDDGHLITQERKMNIGKLMMCTQTPTARVPERKYYLVQWPTPEKELNGIENIRLMGGKVVTLESLYLVEDSSAESEEENLS